MRLLLSLLLLCTLTLYNAENFFYREYAMFKDDDSESDNNSEESSSNSNKS